MSQLPESIRPAVAMLQKHHFWLLALLVPAVLLPTLLVARGGLIAGIGKERATIKGKLQSLSGVQNNNPHPNEGWSAEIDAEATRIRKETLAEWERFWKSQESLRVWPPELGADFLEKVAALQPDGRLARDLLQRYQNAIPEIVRKLPGRMGADSEMGDDNPPAAGDPRADRPRPARSRALVTWSGGDQKQLLQSFVWEKLPVDQRAATSQVTLAQEELWVYGLFCDVIARANQGASGVFDAAIVHVDRLAVGYPAADEQPGGLGGSRILMPTQAADTALPGSPEPRGSKPPHPRFGGNAATPVAGPAAPQESAGAPPDSFLRESIYVDFSGKPLSAQELAESPAARMVHLMPFVIAVTIDERRLDALLLDLARQPIPIDVREVRINAQSGQPTTGDPAQPAGPKSAGPKAEGRNHDVQIELRGTVGLATPPSTEALGLGPPRPDAASGAAARPRARSRRRDREVMA
jgi:hypothetical protein